MKLSVEYSEFVLNKYGPHYSITKSSMPHKNYFTTFKLQIEIQLNWEHWCVYVYILSIYFQPSEAIYSARINQNGIILNGFII